MSDPSDTTHLIGTNPADTIDPNSSDASVARSVYANSLLMSEIYSWLPDMCDKKNRTLISKSGWEEAARVLFRRLRSSALVPLYDQSNPVSALCFLTVKRIILLNGLMSTTLTIRLGADRTDPGIRSRHAV
jgi:hypothetical protein